MNAIIFDTETTAAENGEVIQMAYRDVRILEHGLTSMKAELFNYKPKGEIMPGAMATHHIIEQDLEHAPPFNPSDLPVADFYIGHKVDFDMQFYPDRTGRRICTLAMARRIWPSAEHTLGALFYWLHEDKRVAQNLAKNAHAADVDVWICFYVLRHIVQCVEGLETLEDLANFSDECRIPTHMSFGKFKGQPVSSVDNGWRSWYKKQDAPDPYLLEAFRRQPYER